MGRLFLIAGAAILASSGPAFAKPDHAKQGKHERVDKQRKHERVEREPVGYGAGGCPPGLRRKNPECMPPGQHRKQFEVGQRVPTSHKGLTRYNTLPYELRRQYGGSLDPRARYIYDDQYLYRVDPTTMIVRQVLRGVIGS